MMDRAIHVAAAIVLACALAAVIRFALGRRRLVFRGWGAATVLLIILAFVVKAAVRVAEDMAGWLP